MAITWKRYPNGLLHNAELGQWVGEDPANRDRIEIARQAAADPPDAEIVDVDAAGEPI